MGWCEKCEGEVGECGWEFGISLGGLYTLLNLARSFQVSNPSKCSTSTTYQCKHFKQKGILHIVFFDERSSFEFFCQNCKGNVKELPTSG